MDLDTYTNATYAAFSVLLAAACVSQTSAAGCAKSQSPQALHTLISGALTSNRMDGNKNGKDKHYDSVHEPELTLVCVVTAKLAKVFFFFLKRCRWDMGHNRRDNRRANCEFDKLTGK